MRLGDHLKAVLSLSDVEMLEGRRRFECCHELVISRKESYSES
jgi:hypothetical protein